jgi:hypothetical protein
VLNNPLYEKIDVSAPSASTCGIGNFECGVEAQDFTAFDDDVSPEVALQPLTLVKGVKI